MEPAPVLNMFDLIPIWVWIMAGLAAILWILVDRRLWEYEVKFPFKKGVGRGEIELERLKKKGTAIEVKLTLESAYHHQPVDIYVNDRRVYTVPADKNKGDRLYVKEITPLDKPNEGDEVVVKIGGDAVLSGPLVLD